MRKRFILLTFTIICSIIFINGFFNKAKSDADGAPYRETGSPYDGSNCTSCHSGHPTFTGRGTITTNIPTAGYTANTAYTITATLYSPALKVGGFELSPQDTNATGLVGTITASSNTQLASGQDGWITHTISSNSTTNGTLTWTMTWTAPATGHGPVVFYGAFNRSNDNGSDSGDSIFLASLKIYEDICTAPAMPGAISGNTSVCSGASVTYSVTAVTGATSYVWTLPSGWTGTSTTNSITVTAGTSGGNVTVKASNSCSTSAASSQAVTVTSSSAASISISVPQTSICSGTSLTFTATPTNGGTSPTYQWEVNGSATGSNSTTFTSTTLTNGQVVTCIMTSDLACVTNSPATSNSETITVNSNVTPSVSIATGNQTICSGTSVTFTATPTNGGTAPTYQWKKNNVAINGATGSTYSSSALANGDVITVEITSNATCVTTATATSNGITMTVTSPVTPAIGISSNVGNSICSGQSVTLTATPTNGGTLPTYQWYKNGGAISGATSSTYTTTTIANNDAIYAILTSNATCASPATATSDTITFITVTNATPSVSIASSAGTSICSGASVTFTATPVNGGSAPTYQWKQNGNVITGATSSTYNTDTLANNDQITVVMASNSACVSTTQATSNTIIITIVANVTPAVSIVSGSGNSACSGVNVTFTATPTNGGTTPTYQWLNNGSTILGANSNTYTTAGLANGDIISVSMTSSSSCASPSTATSNTITMSIITGAAASVSVSSSYGNIICTGQNPTFTANPVNGGSAPTYQWILNGSNVSGATSSTYIPTSLSNGDIISVQITSNEQCITQSTVTSMADTLVVSPGGAPTVTVSSNQGDSICQGTTVTFTAVATLGGSSPTYQWMKNGNDVGTNIPTYMDNALATGDAITCSITSSLSCASPTTATSNSVGITVNAPPAVNISVSNDTLTSSSATSYQWYQNNIIIGNATGQAYVPAINGNYTVVVTDAQGCQNSTSVSYVTGINDISDLSTLKVYPNPADGTLFINLNAASVTGMVSLRLYDLSGQMLLNNENALLNGGITNFDVQNLPGGIYLIQVSDGQENVYRKVIISR